MSTGVSVGSFPYRAEEWAEKSIKARRFVPCPHCGAAVVAIERRWTPPYIGGRQAVFREAKCVNIACGWRYYQHGGTRDEFVDGANRRNKG